MKRILAALVILEFSIRFFVSGDNIWYSDDIVDSVQVIALCYLLAHHVRRNILAWCITVAYGMCETLEALSNIVWYYLGWYNSYLDAVRVIVALIVLSYYRYRRYDIPTATRLSPSYFYLTYRRPVSLQDRLLTLIGTPLGGVGVYTRGNWYHYSNGQFVVSCMQPSNKHVMIKSEKYSDNVIKRLNELVGTRWGLLNNCMTEILPVVRLGRRIALIPKPQCYSDK